VCVEYGYALERGFSMVVKESVNLCVCESLVCGHTRLLWKRDASSCRVPQVHGTTPLIDETRDGMSVAAIFLEATGGSFAFFFIKKR
jgi:hypothetical protein